MSSLGLVVALPEMVLLAAASMVLVVDLFVSDERRNVTYGLTMLTLLLVGAAVCVALARNEVVIGFGGMYIADPMGHVLKLFAIFCSGFMLICAQSYARARGIWKGELFSLTLFTLLGIMLMISANNLLVIYLGLELQSLSMYALVALRRDIRARAKRR
jgi:NADH-quinone oxidoreductase subunit N